MYGVCVGGEGWVGGEGVVVRCICSLANYIACRVSRKPRLNFHYFMSSAFQRTTFIDIL